MTGSPGIFSRALRKSWTVLFHRWTRVFSNEENPDLLFILQLIPELAETISIYQRVCFIDAHTGNVSEDVNVVEVKAEYQRSPFTHHMTADTCLSLVQTIYGQTPQAILISVRGFEFGFSHVITGHPTVG